MQWFWLFDSPLTVRIGLIMNEAMESSHMHTLSPSLLAKAIQYEVSLWESSSRQSTLIHHVCRHQVDHWPGRRPVSGCQVACYQATHNGWRFVRFCVFDNHTFATVVSSVSSPSLLFCLPQHPYLLFLLSAVTHCGCEPELLFGTRWVVVGCGWLSAVWGSAGG